MGKYLLKRLVNYLVLLFIAVSIVYLLAASRLDPKLLYPIEQPTFDLDQLNRQLSARNVNPDDPLFSRYWTWLKGVVTRWDWGEKPRGGLVVDEISRRVWVSVRLVTIGFLTGTTIGIIVGAWTATRQYKFSDRAITMWSLIVIAVPVVVIGIVTQIATTRITRLFGWRFEYIGEYSPLVRREPFWTRFLDRIEHLTLPTLTLAIAGIAIYSRYQRNLMLDALGADYVRTARAKGLSKRKALFKHALRTSLIPVGTFFAFSVATLFLGATLTEIVFSWEGMGRYVVDSINFQDINGTAAVAAFAGTLVFLGAMMSEVFVVLLDPRVRVR